MMVTSIREAHVSDRRLTFRELIERLDIGNGTMHRVLMEDFQIFKVVNSILHDACCKGVRS